MPEIKEIQIDAIYETVNVSNVLNLVIKRAKDLANTIKAQIHLDYFKAFKNNNEVNTGDLVITMKNHLNKIDYNIEERTGELFIHAEDSKNYHIDEDGYLIYTFR